MKVIAKTTGPFELFDMYSRSVVGPNRPAIISWSQFFEARTGAGQIEVLKSNLPDTASDEEFAEYWRESPEIAVEAYASSFEEAPEPEAKPVAKRGAKKEA